MGRSFFWQNSDKQKLTNLKKKEDFLGHKNKMGLSSGKKLGKKLSIKAKNDQFSKQKKRIFGSKIGKKGLFWAKILIKIEFKGEKLTSSQKKEKRTFRAEKKQAGAELKNKKRTFLGKNFEKN